MERLEPTHLRTLAPHAPRHSFLTSTQPFICYSTCKLMDLDASGGDLSVTQIHGIFSMQTDRQMTDSLYGTGPFFLLFLF
jgi:hypothetical protein